MTELLELQRQALEPLRRALLANAHAEADGIRRAADDAGRAEVEAAEREVAGMLARAREQGAADGAALRRADESRARSAARADLLATQRGTYDELQRRSREAVRELLGAPGNRERLAGALRRELGGEAEVADTDDGGLTARAAHGRSIDASVGALVDRALASLDLEQLWTAG